MSTLIYAEAVLKFAKLNTVAQQRGAFVQGRSLSPYRLRYITPPLVADNAPQTRPYALIFQFNLRNKGIRARWVALLATKGNLINKGCMLKRFVKRCCPVRNY
ncbi:MAG: hypothetical protein LBK06_03860 [Planctomycetaceae bacterium]|nr:hypothetical protein [Planctomycetaceae bacterium]